MHIIYKSFGLCVVVMTGLLTGCSSKYFANPAAASPSTVQVPVSATLLISGTTTLDFVGQTSQLHVDEIVGTAPAIDATTSAGWGVTQTSSFTISNSGLVTCTAAGTGKVSATKDDASSSIPFTCNNSASTLTLSRQSISAQIGSMTAITASAGSPAGVTVDVTRSTAWKMGSSIATVDSAGLVSCAQNGQTTVTAAYSSLAQTIPVSCSPSSWTSPAYFMEQSDEFVGPFPSWVNVKTAFGATGDGNTDDTAAIQKAFDSINAPEHNNHVLWFPAGTYLITSPVTLRYKRSFSVIGEDPRTTKMKWAGPGGGTILQTDASAYFKISRISFDGSNSADIAENLDSTGTGGFYATFNELSDQHITGVKVGIKLSVAAETTIERVFFDHVATFGVQTGNANVLNIFINDSLFMGCGTGVSNYGGAGSFIVTNSFFSGSIASDMSVGNTSYFTARHNTSVGSGAFFYAGPIGANPAQITIQNNTILDPVGIPLQLGDQGPLMVIDNVVRMKNQSLPAIQGFFDNTVTKSLFTFGNTFTTNIAPRSDGAPAFQGTIRSYDDAIVDPSQIADVAIPANVYVPPNLHRPIFDVPTNATGDAIQAQINAAAKGGSTNAVIHLPAGTYRLASTLTLPQGTELQLVGDDSDSTVLQWDGKTGGAALDLESDTVSVRDIRLNMGSGQVVDGIRIPVQDQPTTQVIVDQAQLQGGNAYSVNFDGVEHATTELFSAYTQGSATGVSVTGGPFRKSKLASLGVTNFYTGSLQSEGSATSFSVSLGGKFMVQDNWHDGGATSPRNFVLSGSGTVTEQSGSVYMNSNQPFEIDDFDGKVSLIGLMFSGGFLMKPGQGSTQLLTLGMDGIDPNYLPQNSGNLIVNNLLDEYYGPGVAGRQITSQDSPDPQWLRGMLAQTRSEYPVQRLPMIGGGSRKRLARVEVFGFASALHILPSIAPNLLYYTLASAGETLTNGPAGTGQCSTASRNVPSNPVAWKLVDGGDGDYILADSTGTNALGIVGGGTALGMSVLNSQYSQRWIVQDLGDGQRSFKNRATGGALAWVPGTCPQLAVDATSDSAKWTLAAH